MRNNFLQTLYQDFLQGNTEEILSTIDSEKDRLTQNEYSYLMILKIRILLRHHQNEKAYELVNAMLADDLDTVNKIKFLNYKAKISFAFGNDKEALHILEDVSKLLATIEKNEEYDQELINLKINRFAYEYYRGDIDLAINYIMEAKFLAEELDDPYLLGICYANMARAHIDKGEFSKALELLQTRLDYFTKLGYTYYIIESHVYLSNLYFETGDFNKSLEIIEKSKKLLDDHDFIDLEYDINNALALIYQYIGELDKGKLYLKKNIEIASKLQSQSLKSVIYNNLGNLYHMVGEIDLALEYLFLSLSISEELGNRKEISACYNNLALNYKIKGELDLSLQYLYKSLEINEEIGDESSLATCYVNIGRILHLKGDFENAENYYLKCLEIDRKFGNDLFTSETVLNLLSLAIEQEDSKKAEDYLEELEEINARNDNRLIRLRYRLGKMQVLKNSSRAINKAKAQEILQEILKEDPIDFELYVFAMFNLCDLLLLELKQTGEEEVVQEIKEVVEKLQKMATQQNSHSLLGQVYLIKSRIAILELDIKTARSLLEEAIQIVANRGLDKLELQINNEYDALLDKIKIYEKYVEENISLTEMLQQVQLEELFARSLDRKLAKNKAIEEKPVMLLIINEGGNTLYKQVFDESIEIQEELIAGLFKAFHSLSEEVFHTDSGVQRIKHGEYTIVLKPVHKLLFSYIFKGKSYTAIKRIEQLIKIVKESKVVWNTLMREVPQLTPSEYQGIKIFVDDLMRTNRILN